jgi:hypothetical protein
MTRKLSPGLSAKPYEPDGYMRINPELNESNESPTPVERSTILAARLNKTLRASYSLTYLDTPPHNLPDRFMVMDSESLCLFEATAN